MKSLLPFADRNSRSTPCNVVAIHQAATNCYICPAGQRLYSGGSRCTVNGRVHHKFTGSQASCVSCAHRHQCLRDPQRTRVRQVAIFAKNQHSPHEPAQRMKQAIDSPRGRAKVSAQWQLYCLVHNIEKLAHHGYQ